MVASAVSTADVVCSSHFQALDQNGLEKILEDTDSQRTKQITKWAVAVLKGTYALFSVCKFMFLLLCWFTICSLCHSHFIWTTIQSDCMHIDPCLPIHLQI